MLTTGAQWLVSCSVRTLGGGHRREFWHLLSNEVPSDVPPRGGYGEEDPFRMLEGDSGKPACVGGCSVLAWPQTPKGAVTSRSAGRWDCQSLRRATSPAS